MKKNPENAADRDRTMPILNLPLDCQFSEDLSFITAGPMTINRLCFSRSKELIGCIHMAPKIGTGIGILKLNQLRGLILTTMVASANLL